MDTKAKSQFRLLFPCYFSFFVNGAMVLLVLILSARNTAKEL